MRAIGIAIALSSLCTTGIATAAGLKTLKAVEKAGSITERTPNAGVRLRAPLGTQLKQLQGRGAVLPTSVVPDKTTAKSTIFHLPVGVYRNPSTARNFRVLAK